MKSTGTGKRLGSVKHSECACTTWAVELIRIQLSTSFLGLFHSRMNIAESTTSWTFPVGKCCLLQQLSNPGSHGWAPGGSRTLAATCRDSPLPFYGSVKMNPKAHFSENSGSVSV